MKHYASYLHTGKELRVSRQKRTVLVVFLVAIAALAIAAYFTAIYPKANVNEYTIASSSSERHGLYIYLKDTHDDTKSFTFQPDYVVMGLLAQLDQEKPVRAVVGFYNFAQQLMIFDQNSDEILFTVGFSPQYYESPLPSIKRNFYPLWARDLVIDESLIYGRVYTASKNANPNLINAKRLMAAD